METVPVKKEEYARLKKLERSFGKLLNEVAPLYESTFDASQLLHDLHASQKDIGLGKGKILRSLKALR